jgi:hypothetical protein
MDPASTPLLVALVIVGGIALVIAYRQHREHRRTALLRAWAGEQGWTYTSVDRDRIRRYEGEPFSRDGHARHVLAGEHRGRQVFAFEYRRRGQGGPGASLSPVTHHYQVVAVATPSACPRLEVTREHVGHRLLGAVGVHDLQLGHTEWDATYRVRTDDDDFTRRLLNEDLMRWMLADRRAGMRAVRFDSGDLLTWHEQGLDPRSVLREADYLIDLLERCPDRAWNT